ncbi:MAG: class A beta-lactamase-related serine hydrolase [Chitinophagaceae bacterium]|nr:MAG: class A beta-lactamase-related serine hydrolase [Chitinophagaceae bacterium]
MVADKGKVIFQASFGNAGPVGYPSLTRDYRFHIGSIAKEMNAVAIMKLAEQGKLKVTDKISNYLPGLPRWSDSVSILNLLQYTSGVPNVKWKTVSNDGDNWSDLVHTAKLDFRPGSKYDYNNNNVYLQRRIIASVSGKDFNRYVVEELLNPAGVTDAVMDPTEKDRMMARAFDNKGSIDPLAVPISGWTAFTIEGFYKWTMAIRNFKLISPASTSVILTGYKPGNQSGLGGGMLAGDTIVSHVHDGTARNYQALLADYPAKGRTILLMTNNQQNNLYAFEKSVNNFLDGQGLVPVRKSLRKDLDSRLDSMDCADFMVVYKELKRTAAEEYAFESETTLNEIGYGFLGQNRVDDAICVFEFNTTLFPRSGNVFDSLGEAWYKKANKPKALLNYKRAVELDPGNETAQRIVRELSK